jgi:hypothetical protein
MFQCVEGFLLNMAKTPEMVSWCLSFSHQISYIVLGD